MVGGSEPLINAPACVGLGSTLCRQLHFSLDEFRYWMRAMAIRPALHRKYWEFFYIAQCLHEAGMLAPGKKGLAFAVGREPLPALFASFGCEILATDQDPEQAVLSGWANSNQYSQQIDDLFKEGVCDHETFFSLVRYRSVDMNFIPGDLREGFDFCWSSCCWSISAPFSMESVSRRTLWIRFGPAAWLSTRPSSTSPPMMRRSKARVHPITDDGIWRRWRRVWKGADTASCHSTGRWAQGSPKRSSISRLTGKARISA
jgi:hypothetical protein